jgi:hypothetical protein
MRALAWRLAAPVSLLFLFLLSFAVGRWLPTLRAERSMGAALAGEEHVGLVSARPVTMNGTEMGEVLVNGIVAIRVRTTAGGTPPYRRAEIVAYRLNAMMADGANPADIRAARLRGYATVMLENTVLITVDREHADLNRTTPFDLAQVWAMELRNAFGVEDTAPPEQGEGSESKGVTWKPAEPYKDKIVPILSLGRGKRVGAARVNGPQSKVRDVNAVAQLETDFKDFVEIEVYVPVSTEDFDKDLGRVQGVGVTGVGDYRF